MPGTMQKLLKLSVKLGACGGTVYYTAREGVWADSSTAQHTYLRLTQHLPDVRQYIPSDLNLPETAEMRRSASLYWNWAVIGLSSLAARSPYILAGLAVSTKDMLSDMLVVTPEQVKEKGGS
ncbi:MICOS complex subunit MIC13 homolog QIL1-like [Pollicipes pollicipes]|uniref:MICOS complex subunit MIC13 homolog QIL1-like n=1 Tax=Pollicipes pollicipes TaxID=41117 RepID=UPI001884F126|nr:MICOS complex subunit MIC13 homolog QIL1-like [Pollicipes pollicipes]XP_037074249.1 MICOS complex subunit MIC13 homolog QIL1-like [Pollicipes pollicipes]XP_037074250.1 MICOS complex subunit MIC13 homolog QIL1-like [Pollicipes pollicipes]XP_037074251.1 MICOS complex subunit MIC13 homolog QIL1-like [Pollicipes pollicipes]